MTVTEQASGALVLTHFDAADCPREFYCIYLALELRILLSVINIVIPGGTSLSVGSTNVISSSIN
jgi:hypothetical protein